MNLQILGLTFKAYAHGLIISNLSVSGASQPVCSIPLPDGAVLAPIAVGGGNGGWGAAFVAQGGVHGCVSGASVTVRAEIPGGGSDEVVLKLSALGTGVGAIL